MLSQVGMSSNNRSRVRPQNIKQGHSMLNIFLQNKKFRKSKHAKKTFFDATKYVWTNKKQ